MPLGMIEENLVGDPSFPLACASFVPLCMHPLMHTRMGLLIHSCIHGHMPLLVES